MAKFKYLGKTLTDKNCMLEKMNAYLTQEMLAVIRCRIFCHPVCYPKI